MNIRIGWVALLAALAIVLTLPNSAAAASSTYWFKYYATDISLGGRTWNIYEYDWPDGVSHTISIMAGWEFGPGTYSASSWGVAGF
ncbi:hypothetical protein [Streptomyces sp. 351MFTsu5.1]|uniref:hypothetical protein n=1 Tax=Streptomyces sp. 351MFTsu5.1 TaxID=1172180 RepID=UPI0003821D8A|nr:hypothetical protein [Streptomyces sp. 351MFTsu5.1]